MNTPKPNSHVITDGPSRPGARVTRTRTILLVFAIAIAACICLSGLWVVRLGLSGVVRIGPDERGVVVSKLVPGSYRSKALGPGVYWAVPMFDRVQIYSVAPQTYTMSATSANIDDSIRVQAADGQEVRLSVSVVYAVDPDQVIALHATWQDRYQDQVVRPLTRGITRDIAALYNAEELSTGRQAEIEQSIADELAAKLDENYLLLIDFDLDVVR